MNCIKTYENIINLAQEEIDLWDQVLLSAERMSGMNICFSKLAQGHINPLSEGLNFVFVMRVSK